MTKYPPPPSQKRSFGLGYCALKHKHTYGVERLIRTLFYPLHELHGHRKRLVAAFNLHNALI